MKQLFDDSMVENLLKTAARSNQSAEQNQQWDSTMGLTEKATKKPKDKTAIQESFDYVYERLGGHDAFLSRRNLAPRTCKSFMSGGRRLFKKNLRPPYLKGRSLLTS